MQLDRFPVDGNGPYYRNRRIFMKPSKQGKNICLALLMGMMVFSWAGCSGISVNPEKPSGKALPYPISDDVETTVQRTVLPTPVPANAAKIFPYQVAEYSPNGYGKWQFGPGMPAVKRLDLMPAGYTDNTAVNAAKLVSFFTITDAHIQDKESPVSLIYFGYKGGNWGNYSPVMLTTTQILDATVQTANALNKKDPHDFLLYLGDAANATQYNELRWLIDVLDGKQINPDSGAKDDPIPGPDNDYQDPYQAAGLDKSIPWYATIGNHDHFFIGQVPLTDALSVQYTGPNIINLGNVKTDPLGFNSHGFYMGSINGRTAYGDIIGVGPQANFATPPQVLAADPNRHGLTRNQWIGEFLKSSTNPAGHGFTQSNQDSGFACYSFEPKADLPIKVIMLDDTQSDNDPNIGGYSHGSLDQARYEWLVYQLDQGQAENKLMIIGSHVPIGVAPAGAPDGWWSGAYVSEQDLIAKLHQYPNLILWVAGHRHINVITPMPSPDSSHPELGFWEVETASLKDYPQNFRSIDILRNSDNTLSIRAIDVDPAVKDGSIAATSRFYAIATHQLFNTPPPGLPTGVFNGELVKQLSPEMQIRIKDLGTPIKN